jgi:hypothetical protein
MIDMAKTVEPKSDQINADDLTGRSLTITVTKITGNDNADQPVNVHFEGDNGKPYRPCKSMRRVMIAAWGLDASKYVGQAMTLYCDPEVQFGGIKTGGIRISHMSGIERDMVIALTATRAKRKPYTVKALTAKPVATADDKKAAAKKKADSIIADINSASTHEAVDAIFDKEKAAIARMKDAYSDIYESIQKAGAAQITALQKPATYADEELPI